MSIGLKNAQSIIPYVTDIIHFAVNEECNQRNECDSYNSLAPGIPAFNIEYIKPRFNTQQQLTAMSWVSDEGNELVGGGSMEQIQNNFCKDVTQGQRLSTVIKEKDLSGFVLYCGKGLKYETTDTVPGPERKIKECLLGGRKGEGRGKSILGKSRAW